MMHGEDLPCLLLLNVVDFFHNGALGTDKPMGLLMLEWVLM